MKKIILISIIVFLNFSVYLQSIQKKDLNYSAATETKSIVDAAYDYVSKYSENMSAVQYALLNETRFFNHEKNLYVFIHCYDELTGKVICCGQGVRPELVGKDMSNLRTPNGRLLFQEFIKIVENSGQGWLEYEWLNPYTKTIKTKISYIRGIILKDGRKAWIGCGYWKN